MIKPSELRIGNNISLEGKYWGVSELQERDIWLKQGTSGRNSTYQIIEPIILNSEIFERCGAKSENQHRLFIFNPHYWKVFRTVDNKYEFAIRTDDFGDLEEGIEITFLHQLQNLYYSLTGGELVFK